MSSNSVNNKGQPATCTFVVNNFSNISCPNNGSYFCLPSDSNISFMLCLNTNIDLGSTPYWESKNVSFSILNNYNEITVRYRISIVNSKGQKCNTQEGNIKFPGYRQFGGQYILSRKDIMNSKGWLVNDILTVYCEVYLVDSDLDVDTPPEEPIKASTMSHDYGSLFESGKLSDLVLVAGGTEFKVHKLILSARSAVFGAMFSHDTKENQDNRIEVTDVSAEAYHELLRYIYTDKVENLQENALELMVAADKYQLELLKSTCEQYLSANLATDSVAITLVMADMHRSEALKMKCLEYICDNVPDVEPTEGWKTLLTKPELISKVILHLYNKQKK